MPSKRKAIKVGVIGILVNHRGEILMGRRVKDDPSFPGMWCIPGGGIELGETHDEALIREFKEEVCLPIIPEPLVMSLHQRIVNDTKGGVARHTLLISKVVRLEKSEYKPFRGDGFDAIGWFSWLNISQIKKQITPLTLEALRAYYVNRIGRFPPTIN